MTHERCDCKKLSAVVYGLKPDQTDGMLSITLNNSIVLFGTKDNPGGLIKEVAEIKKETAKLSLKISIAIGVGSILLNYGPALAKVLFK